MVDTPQARDTTGDGAAQAVSGFHQPKPWIRWLAVLVAAAGWYVSLQLLKVSAGGTYDNALLEALCGGSGEGEANDCASVLTSPEAYVRLGTTPGSPRLPISALGMAYFAFVGLWYLFVGPPARAGRAWHLLLGLVIVLGAWQSVGSIHIMHAELKRWCGGCLLVHVLNGVLVVLTCLAWPWRRAGDGRPAHPGSRLAIATATAGVLSGLTHVAVVLMFMIGSHSRAMEARYKEVLDDPAFIVWDFQRQPVVDIPMEADEAFVGRADAPRTIVVFSDFQCAHCKTLHDVLAGVLERHGDRVRVAYRYFPQDSECNPDPNFRVGGHASACRAAWAAEAVRQVAGAAACARMRDLLFERQRALPTVAFARQSEARRALFADWAAELGVDRAAFEAAFEGSAVRDRVARDIALAGRLDLSAMPVVFVDGRRLRNWTQPNTWDAVLSSEGK